MSLNTVENKDGSGEFNTTWDWKNENVANINGDGLDRFSQQAITPDSTLAFVGPTRFTKVSNERLHAMGLIDSFSLSSQAMIQPLYEMGSNRTFFSKGKTQNQLQISSMLADHANLTKALLQECIEEKTGKVKDTATDLYSNITGMNAASQGQLALNLDSESFGVPFGILLLFKTKGSEKAGQTGKIIGAVYLENCMIQGLNLNVQAQAPTVQENVSIMFDRAVPVQVS